METIAQLPSWVTAFAVDVDASSWRRVVKDARALKTLYAESSLTVPSHPRIIFYESMSGHRMMDSPLALFEHLLTRPEFTEFTHIWSVADQATIDPCYRALPNVHFARRHTPEYVYCLTRARHIVGNSALPPYFVRKPEQRYLNTWHGIGYKALGRSAKGSPFGASGGMTNMLQATHLITPCDFMTQQQLYCYSLDGVASAPIAETGYPRLDMTLNLTANDADAIRTILGLTPGRKAVLYAPTWRKSGDSEYFDDNRLADDLRALAALDATIIFLGHHKMSKYLTELDVVNIVIPPTHIPTNKLLGIVDVLITDYSSIFFDVLPLDVPIVHYVYDFDEYESERGLSLTLDELPGDIARTQGELVDVVGSHVTEEVYQPSDRYRAAKRRFAANEDGSSSRRAADFFFFDRTDGVPVTRPAAAKHSVVFWAGDLDESEEGVEFIRAAGRRAESGLEHVALLISRRVRSYPAVMAALGELGPSVAVIGRLPFGFETTSAEESARERARSTGRRDPEAAQLYRSVYHREYQRLFGDATFDEVVRYRNLKRPMRELSTYALR